MKNLWVLIGILCGFLVHKPLGVACDVGSEDLNKRVAEALSKYMEKPTNALMLSVIYNEDLKSLSSFAKMSAPKADDSASAEKHLKQLNELAPHYDDIVPKMEAAIQELKKIDENPDKELQFRYDALKVQTMITFSTSIKEAEEALKRYEDFKKEHKIM